MLVGSLTAKGVSRMNSNQIALRMILIQLGQLTDFVMREIDLTNDKPAKRGPKPGKKRGPYKARKKKRAIKD